MRPDSLEYVRAQRARGETMRPIQISVYVPEGPVVVDGRHRVMVARELGDATIRAVVRHYSRNGNLVATTTQDIPLASIFPSN